ncbi:hypothetical protein M413DRAFT_449033 [Hebeloma cylindrosporum]|uniref:Uncharacterized protein n=1 Tax=Hebeloma cylindrosporum TaxID=76867 RepID=A0A0C3BJ24_HEBCY|nr:hypothetical protein M413DRAFT_449033 [Hebeloma cylindrosporum h7]
MRNRSLLTGGLCWEYGCAREMASHCKLVTLTPYRYHYKVKNVGHIKECFAAKRPLLNRTRSVSLIKR